MFYTLGKYAANHTLTSCFSQGTCQNCNKVLHLLGMDIDHVGTTDLCKSALMSAYAEAIHHPYYSLRMATKGIEVIRQGIADLASMPEMAAQYHRELASFMNTQSSAAPHIINFQNILDRAGEIYKKGASTWLYVGLPEVFAKVKQLAKQDEEQIAKIIGEVYDKWRVWGKENTLGPKAQ